MLKQSIISETSANLMFAGICMSSLLSYIRLAELHDFHIIFAKQMEALLSDWDTTETGIGSLFLEHVRSWIVAY
jgi:hypothetical protein